MSDVRSRFCWWAVSLLSLAGLGLATYLSVVYLSGHGPACGAGASCEVVTTSRYALFLHVPVAMIGAAGYSILLLGSLAIVSSATPITSLRYGMITASGVGFCFSLYLTMTQAFFIHAFCAYCLASATMMTLILILSLAAVVLVRSATGASEP